MSTFEIIYVSVSAQLLAEPQCMVHLQAVLAFFSNSRLVLFKKAVDHKLALYIIIEFHKTLTFLTFNFLTQQTVNWNVPPKNCAHNSRNEKQKQEKEVF